MILKGSSGCFLLLLTGILACISSCSKQGGSRPGEVTIGVVTGLGGVTEPCGCTSKPLGGLNRLAGRVTELQREQGLGLIVAGDTFYEFEDPPGHLLEQEERKAELIRDVLAGLQPLVVLVGPRDLKRGADTIVRSARKSGMAVFGAVRNVESQFRADTVLREIGGVKIGLIGVPGDRAASEVGSYVRGAAALRAQGARVVIALVPFGGRAGEHLVAQLSGINVAVIGGGDDVFEPRMVGSTLMVEASNKGQRLGLLSIVTQGQSGGSFVFDDGGRALRQSLNTRIESLTKAIARMPEGGGRDARQKKLNDLEKQLATMQPVKPVGPYISWRVEEITKSQAPATWVSDRLAQYNSSLCELIKRATRDLVCPPLEDPRDGYAGTATCKTCHLYATQVYEQTKHAHAWETLEEAGKQCDVGCVGCHSVGFNEPGGYCRLTDGELFHDVGCENCHGPAAGHAKQPLPKNTWRPGFIPKPTQDQCLTCHNEEHSDMFDFEKYLPNILGPGHGQPLPKK